MPPDRKTVAAQAFRFEDDGETPNNPRLPLVVYRGAVNVAGAGDPAAAFETTFAAHGWVDGWRNGIYDFLHFHTHSHEVLGIARGRAWVEFGGAAGQAIELQAGDVAILPAGTGHRRISCSPDLLVVGAYPEGSTYDERKPVNVSHDKAVTEVAKAPLPRHDPVFGSDGPLKGLWNL
jgi:uncharacterized protein YjlB